MGSGVEKIGGAAKIADRYTSISDLRGWIPCQGDVDDTLPNPVDLVCSKPSGWGQVFKRTCRERGVFTDLKQSQISSAGKEICVPLPPKDVFDKIEYYLFRITLLILFILGLIRIIRAEIGW